MLVSRCSRGRNFEKGVREEVGSGRPSTLDATQFVKNTSRCRRLIKSEPIKASHATTDTDQKVRGSRFPHSTLSSIGLARRFEGKTEKQRHCTVYRRLLKLV